MSYLFLFFAVLVFSLMSPFQCICMKWDLPVRVDSESNMLEVKVLEHLAAVEGGKDVLNDAFLDFKLYQFQI